jgi:hypothetical protein
MIWMMWLNMRLDSVMVDLLTEIDSVYENFVIIEKGKRLYAAHLLILGLQIKN